MVPIYVLANAHTSLIQFLRSRYRGDIEIEDVHREEAEESCRHWGPGREGSHQHDWSGGGKEKMIQLTPTNKPAICHPWIGARGASIR